MTITYKRIFFAFLLFLSMIAALYLGKFDLNEAGPYKVEGADVDGDGIPDLVLAYQKIGVITVQKGDGHGNFSPLAYNSFEALDPIPDRHIHNFDLQDVDRDGLLDIAFGMGGLNQENPGVAIVAKNLGKGVFEEKVRFTIPSQAKAAKLYDLDNDGELDVLTAARGKNSHGDFPEGKLVIRKGDGKFNFSSPNQVDVGRSAYNIEIADLNNDRFPDIIIPNELERTFHIVMNPGPKIFETNLSSKSVSTTLIPGLTSHHVNDIRAGDFNKDGNMDLITANLGTGTTSIFYGRGDGTFSTDVILTAGKFFAFLDVGDLDKDGRLDVVGTHWTGTPRFTVFLNRENGSFFPARHYQSAKGSYGVSLFDVNSDDILDIAVANAADHSVTILIGAGDGTFHSQQTIKYSLLSQLEKN